MLLLKPIKLLTMLKKQKKRFLFCFFMFSFSFFVKGQDNDSIAHNFELSFGQSTLFISQGSLTKIKTDYNIIIPTNSMLFFAAFRPFKTIKLPVFFNLPTESKQYIENGVLISEKASPTFGTGAEFKLFSFSIPYDSKVEIDASTLASVIFKKNNQIAFAPLLTSRIRIIKSQSFIMYLGTSYSVGVNTWGIFYGTGYIF